MKRALLTNPLAHVVLLTAVCLVLLLVPGVGSAFNPDEGLYRAQVGLLEDGDWEVPWPTSSLEMGDGEVAALMPFPHSLRTEEGIAPYGKRPVYPVVLLAASTVFGAGTGPYVVPIAGLVAAALAAWVLAERLRPGAGPIGFWLLVLGPAAIDSRLLWAHTVGAALAGWATVVALGVLKGEKRAWLLGLLCFVGPLLRAELALFGVALGMVLAGAFARPDLLRSGRRRASVLVAAVVAVGASAAGLLLNGSLAEWIVGASTPEAIRGGTSDYLVGRVEGAVRILIQGESDSGEGGLLVLLALALAVLAGLVARQRPHRWIAVVVAAAVLAGGLFAVRTLIWPESMVPGLLAAAPVIVIGLIAWKPVPEAIGSQRFLLGAGVLFVLALLATQYSYGGGVGVEWGGRFLRPLAVAMAAWAGAGLMDVLRAAAPRRVPLLAGAVGLLALVPVVAGLVAIERGRAVIAEITTVLDETAAEVVVTDWRFLPTYMYGSIREREWFLSEVDVSCAAADLLAGGVDQLDLVTIKEGTVPSLASDLGTRVVGDYTVRHLRLSIADQGELDTFCAAERASADGDLAGG